ncbi:PREDICTED: neuropeptide FF receptor 1-like [Branchiostoma belcheri]|uniref:Neuropeptide FF receptor 1-like n=1 Tax=Branchiostoma belcheri TaxID=7741 RepID=A0A6P4XWE2_BRABE|nr:PREDICTED: neuropeptide FF receptor 1-like [Branchiostoma belcheri]
MEVNVSESWMYKQTQPAIALFSVGYSVVFAGTVIGNLIVVVVIATNRHVRGVTDMFIFNLALSDLLIAFLCIPFTLVNHIFIENMFGDAMCRVKALAQGLSVGASVFTLTSIAADRYVVIVHPQKQGLTKKKALLVILGVWIASAAIMAPQAVVSYEKEVLYENHTFHICGEFWPSSTSRQSYTAALFSLCYIIPLVAISLLYSKIATKVWFKPPPGAADGNSRGTSGEKAASVPVGVAACRMRVVRMVIALVVVFATTWMPLYICWLLEDFGNLSLRQQINLHHYVYPTAHLVAYANSFINPLVYGFFTTNFRQHFNQTFRKATGSRPMSLATTMIRRHKAMDDVQTGTAHSTPMTSLKVNVVNGNGNRLKGVVTTAVTLSNNVQETTL